MRLGDAMVTTQARHKGKMNDQKRQGGAESSDYNVETRAKRVQCQLILKSLPGGVNQALLRLG